MKARSDPNTQRKCGYADRRTTRCIIDIGQQKLRNHSHFKSSSSNLLKVTKQLEFPFGLYLIDQMSINLYLI